MPLRALVRPVSCSLAACELSHKEREPIDVVRAAAQHRGYVAALAAAGVVVQALEELPEHPDAVFVEDPLLVLDEVAVVCRPGVASRQGEAASLAAAIAPYRPLLDLPPEACLEGGDVMRVGRTLYVGRSERSNDAAYRALAELLGPFGYGVVTVPLQDCLHLKTAVTFAGGAGKSGFFLVNPEWLDASALAGHEIVPLPESEPWAANTLTIGDRVLLPAGFPRTRDLLAGRGLRVETVDVSELQKAEGSVTCLSVIFTAPSRADSR
jgi:dimethylargininase